MFGNIKMKNLIRAVYILFVLTLVTTVTFSRYMKNIAGFDSLSVAPVYLGTEFNELDIKIEDLQPGGSADYIFSVTNTTEDDTVSGVKQNYTISITDTDNLPLTYELEPVADEDGTELTVTALTDATNHATDTSVDDVYTGGVMPFTETLHYYKLTVTWTSETYDDNWNYSNEIELITITVDSVQAN